MRAVGRYRHDEGVAALRCAVQKCGAPAGREDNVRWNRWSFSRCTTLQNSRRNSKNGSGSFRCAESDIIVERGLVRGGFITAGNDHRVELLNIRTTSAHVVLEYVEAIGI